MEEVLTPQEMFDTQVGLGAVQSSILDRFNTLWAKHSVPLAEGIMSAEYYRDLATIAEDHDLKYTPPIGIGVLTGVGSPVTLH